MLLRIIFIMFLGLISFYLLAVELNTWGVVIGLIAGFLYRKVVNNGGL